MGEELHEAKDLVFKSTKIVIPVSLRKDMLSRVHEGHLGMQSCKHRARELLYWPGMNADIEELIRRCSICQEYTSQQVKEPMYQRDPGNMCPVTCFCLVGRTTC